MAVTLYKAIKGLDENMQGLIDHKKDPALHNICLALKAIAESLRRIEAAK